MAVDIESVIKQLVEAGVVPPRKLEPFIPPQAQPVTAEELICTLVEQHLLTKFQASRVAAGEARTLILGNYILLDEIGAGGMGQVYKAEHRRMKRVVALKTLPAKTMQDEEMVARFQREVEAAARLRHPNIVAADDADEANGVHFLVMEYVDGKDLSQIVKRDGPMSIDLTIDCTLQAARGLEFAHSEGVVHRDIKPSNLLLDKRGMVKILDMGLARIETGDAVSTRMELTGTGMMMGTVDYVAPEQAVDSKKADARADIYSLGCTLHYLLTGRPVYTGDSMMSCLLAHRDQMIPVLKEARNDVPELLDTIFQQMVAKEPEDRLQSMSEVIAQLEQLPFKPSRNSSTSIKTISSITAISNTAIEQTVNTQIGNTSITNTSGLTKSKRIRRRRRMWLYGLIPVTVIATVLTMIGLNRQLFPKKKDTSSNVVNQSDVKVPEQTQKKSQQADAGSAMAKSDFDNWLAKVIPLPADERLNAVAAKLKELNPGFDAKIQPGTKIENGKVVSFRIHTNEITDIRAVRALPELRELNLGDYSDPPSKLADLSPIAGMRLQTFFLCNAPLDDLSPLRGMPLWSATLLANRITDLSPLEGMDLGVLRLTFNPVSNLQPLSTLKKLDQLDVSNTAVKDLSPLKGLNITTFHVNNTPIADLSPLISCPIRALGIMSTEVTDLTPLKDIPREVLAFSPQKITRGIEVVRANKSLQWIVEGESKVQYPAKEFWQKYDAGEFAPNYAAMQEWLAKVRPLLPEQQIAEVVKKLKELNPGFDGNVQSKNDGQVVTEFHLRSDEIVDLSPIKAFSSLKEFRCQGSNGKSPLTDLSPLHDLPLSTLGLSGCSSLKDISPLQGIPLTHVNLQFTAVKDLSPLQGMRLNVLHLDQAPIKNLSPLRGMPLDLLSFTTIDEVDLSPLEGMPLKRLTVGEVPFVQYSHFAKAKLKSFSASSFPFRDLSIFKEIPTEWLTIGDSAVHDLSPLRGKPITSLQIWGTLVTDLSPLKGSPLESLWISANRFHADVSDLSPINEMPLKELRLRPSLDVDIDMLRSHKTLIRINDRPVEEFCHLIEEAQVRANRPLAFRDPKFEDWVSQVSSLPTEEQLKTVSEKLKELNPGFDGFKGHHLNDGKVDYLVFDSAHVLDLSPLRAFKKLSGLDISRNSGDHAMESPGDLSPLRGLPLTTLECRDTRVADLSPLKDMKLIQLGCGGAESHIADLSALKGMPLTYLILTETRVTDLSPLESSPLNELLIVSAPISDLTPLKDLSLKRLTMWKTKVDNFDALKGKAIESLNIGIRSPAELEMIRSLPQLQTLNGKPKDQVLKAYESVSDGPASAK